MPKSGPNYTDEEKDEIIAHILVNVATGRFISRVLAEDKETVTGVKIPSASTFWMWIFQAEGTKGDELSEKLARARSHGIEALLDECGEIADDGVNDYMEKMIRDQKVEVVNTEHIQRSKLRIETRIKLAQMLKPKKYGPKLDLTSDGKSINVADEIRAARLRQAKLVDRKD